MANSHASGYHLETEEPVNKSTLGRLLVAAAAVLLCGAQTIRSDLLLLTEVYYDTPYSDGEEEWVEIFNPGSSIVDLSDFKVGDEEEPGGQEGMVRFPSGASLEPGQVIIVAQTATGFRGLFGHNPDYEIKDTEIDVPDMRSYPSWATGNVALANDGDELLLLDGQDNIVDAINYGDRLSIFNPSINDVFRGQSIERVPADCDTDSAAEWRTQSAPGPGRLLFDGQCPQPLPISVPDHVLSIGAVQGSSDASSLLNQLVKVRGVVTGLREDQNSRGIIFYSLFIQDVPGDGDPATSDGIAVFMARQRPSHKIGDAVTVTGTVSEFFGLTEIIDPAIAPWPEGDIYPIPVPVPLAPPLDREAAASYFEAFEGMLVTLEHSTLIVGPTHSGCGFAVAKPVSTLSRSFRRTSLDSEEHVIQLLHASDVDCGSLPNVKSGDRITGLRGPLTYHFDRFKIVNQDPETLEIETAPLMSIPPAPRSVEGQLAIATFNLENHFDSLDDTGLSAEPKFSPQEIRLKRAKQAFAITTILGCPTVIAVQEVENASLLAALAEATEESCHFLYEVNHLESVDVRGIDVALLTHPDHVEVMDIALRRACSPIATGIIDVSAACAANQEPLFSRPPLQVKATLYGEAYTFLVNHFKSKRDGEPSTAPRRLAQAQFVNELVDEYLAEDAQGHVVLLGDFNDYELSPTMLAMTSGSGRLVNTLLSLNDSERYTTIFDGESQLVDGILVSPSLEDRIAQVAIMHVNADQPVSMAEDISLGGMPFRSSDHDIPLIILNSARLDESSAGATPLAPETAATLPTSSPKAAATAPSAPPSSVLVATQPSPRKTATATPKSTLPAAVIEENLGAGMGENPDLVQETGLRFQSLASMVLAWLIPVSVILGAAFYIRVRRRRP